ncbi:MAG: methylated-DNA--[protein]-cysteine S-methyltransferase [Gammaproteobacteria bacterium]|nr:MAG: methylated-DNA--[protein]-cysteine S-methyltransferase [Gammaproteobacteria bacterium]
MKHIYYQYFKSSFGEIVLGSFDNKLCICDWRFRKMRDRIDNRIKNGLKAKFAKQNSEVLEETIQQLNEYFNYKRKIFDIPLLMVGTDFQKSVWNGLLKIPFGKTSSYLELAENVANSNSVRAVASANGANAISIIIPCHRIVGSNGKLVGYAGGLKVKEKLLSIENDLFN